MSKKGENIYKRKDGRWEARYIRAYASDGSAKYGYCYGKTYSEAKIKLGYARSAMICGLSEKEQRSAGAKRFYLYCDEWLQLKRSCVKSSTYVKYLAIIEKHIKPRLGSFPISSFTSLVAEQFGYDLIHEQKLSVKSTRDALTVFGSILAYAEKQNVGMQKIEIIYPKSEKKEMRVLSREEQEKLMNYLLEDMDNCKFGTLFTLLTGLRIGEVCALRWKDISLKDGTVTVSSSMQRLKDTSEDANAKTKIVISDPKSFSSARVIPLSPLALILCERFYTDAANAYILTGDEQRFLEPRALQYHMEKYAKACGLDGVHFHTLRHSFATRCVEVGFEIKSLSEVLGHASPKITLERYVHSSMELKRENMKKLASIGY